jgi:hypothetical protein
LTRQEAAAIRQAITDGYTVVFPNRHQWRHFQVRHPQ